MKRRALRIFVLLWLGWYLSGPLAEVVDFWDTPRQEVGDILRSAGGLVALVGAALAIVLSQIRKLRERFRVTRRPWLGPTVIRNDGALRTAARAFFLPSHSPPVQLRI